MTSRGVDVDAVRTKAKAGGAERNALDEWVRLQACDNARGGFEWLDEYQPSVCAQQQQRGRAYGYMREITAAQGLRSHTTRDAALPACQPERTAWRMLCQAYTRRDEEATRPHTCPRLPADTARTISGRVQGGGWMRSSMSPDAMAGRHHANRR